MILHQQNSFWQNFRFIKIDRFASQFFAIVRIRIANLEPCSKELARVGSTKNFSCVDPLVKSFRGVSTSRTQYLCFRARSWKAPRVFLKHKRNLNMKVIFYLIFLLICADHHTPEKTRRKTEFGKSREKSLSRKPRRYLGSITARVRIQIIFNRVLMKKFEKWVKLISWFQKWNQKFSICPHFLVWTSSKCHQNKTIVYVA